MSAVGTLQKVTVGGVTYDVMADININFMRSDYEKESVPTSGDPMIKMTKRNQNIENVDIAVDTDELETLSGVANSIVDTTLSIALADGTVYRSSGHITFSGYESDSGKLSLTLLPTKKWTKFNA